MKDHFIINRKSNCFLVILAIMLVLSLKVNGQVGIGYQFNIREDMTYGDPDSGLKPIFWNNGILVLGFTIDMDSSSYGTTLIFYDTTGIVQWSKTYFHPNYQTFSGYDIVAFNDHSFYVGGACRVTNSSHHRALFGKFNPEGDSIFFKVYPDSAHKSIQSMAFVSPDTLVVASKWDNNMQADQRLIVEKIDTNGIVHAMHIDEWDRKDPKQIIQAPGGNIFLGGTRYVEGNHREVYHNVYDPNLNLLYTVYPSQAINEFFGSFNIVGNRVYHTSRVAVSNPYPNWDQIRIRRLTSSGGVFGSAYVGPLLFDMLTPGYTVTINDNLMALAISSFHLINRNSLYFVDTNFTVLCSTYFNLPNVPDNLEFIGKLAAIPGNRIAATGDILGEDNNPEISQDHWTLLTNNVIQFMDTNCPDTSVGIELPLSSIWDQDNYKIYPNPFRETIYIEPFFDDKDFFEVKIITLSGSTLLSERSQTSVTLNTQHLPEGIYLLSITSPKYQKTKKIIRR